MRLILRAVRTIVLVAAVALLFSGAYVLDVHQNTRPGYALLLSGAVLLILLPVWPKHAEEGGHPVWPLSVIAVLVIAGATLSAYVAYFVSPEPVLSGGATIALWVASAVCIVIACHLWDLRWHVAPFPRLLDTADWGWIVGLFVASTAVRMFNLAVEPPGLAYDELFPLERTLSLGKGQNLPVFWTDFQGYSGLFHYLTSWSIAYLEGFGLDVVQAAKVPGAVCGGFSVAMLYVTVRLLAGRHIAATAGVFLVWQGWHWILSRLYYQYAGDLAWISATTALIVAGLRSQRMSLFATAGFTAALGVAWLKTAPMAVPWAAVLLLEYAASERSLRRMLRFGLIWSGALAVCALPFVVQLVKQPDALWHFTEVSKNRSRMLQEQRLTSAQGYYRGLLSAMTVLQVRDAKMTQHALRPGRPALDMVQSAMATVGLLWCVWRFRRERSARVALLGLALFLWPIVASYPSGDVAAVNRRMAGTSFFVAWMAAQGTSILASKVAPADWRFAVMLAVAAASVVLNVHGTRAVYNQQLNAWYDEFGMSRTYLVRAVREAAAVGPVFFRPEYYSSTAAFGVKDLPNVHIVQTVAEVRDGLAQYAGKHCVVILTWLTKRERSEGPAWIDQLADVIPYHLWQWGPPDLLGMPVYRIAYVQLPRPARRRNPTPEPAAAPP